MSENAAPVPRLPEAPENIHKADSEALWRYLNDMGRFTSDELRRRTATDSATPYVLLFSPNQSVYRVTVNDAGTLETELIQSPPP